MNSRYKLTLSSALALGLILMPVPHAAASRPVPPPPGIASPVSFGAQSFKVNAEVEAKPLNRGSYSVGVVHRLSYPVAAVPISSGFGPRTCEDGPCSTFHNGMDFAASTGAEIKSPAIGTVVTAGFDGDFGNKVVIEHNTGAETLTTIYAHLLEGSIRVQSGQQVARGDLIGQVGDTGRSYGAHLHFEIHLPGIGAVDPEQWFHNRDVLPFPL